MRKGLTVEGKRLAFRIFFGVSSCNEAWPWADSGLGMYLCFAAVGLSVAPGPCQGSQLPQLTPVSVYLAVAGAGQETDRWYQAGPGRCRVYPGAGESGQCQLCRAQVRRGVTTLPVDAGGAMFSHNKHVCR